MKTDIDGIIAKIAKKIETEGRDALFARFEHADSINFDIDGADAWLTVDSQSDTGDDGHWGSSARLEIEYGDGVLMELETAETVSDYAGDDDPRSGTAIHRAERIAYDKLIDEVVSLASSALKCRVSGVDSENGTKKSYTNLDSTAGKRYHLTC